MYEAELLRKDGKIKHVHARSMKGLVKRIEQEKCDLANYVLRRINVDQIKQGRGYEYVE